MKFPVLAFLASFTYVANVVAAPARLIVVGNPGSVVRFGHAAAAASDRINHVASWSTTIDSSRPQRFRHRPSCSGKFRNKAVELSNKLRVVFGLPPIQEFQPGRGPRGDFLHPETSHLMADFVYDASIAPHPMPIQLHHFSHSLKHHHGFHHQQGRPPFAHRLTHALMALGKWEGRAVAFVLGCGLGVLLRMAWVFVVVMFRSCRKEGNEEIPHDSVEYVVFEDAEQPVSPPAYASSEAEKAALEEKNH